MFFRSSPRTSWLEKAVARVFKNRKLLEDQLIPFGFAQGESGFSYGAKLLGGMFEMVVEIRADGSVRAAVCGSGEKENEMVHLARKSPASFMERQLRKEFEEELWHVAECCFEPDVFKHELTRRLIAYVQASYGDDLEYLWRRSPESAVVRRRDNRKWYAVFLMVPRLKLGGDSGEPVEVLNLRFDPCELERYVDGVSRFPAYHMNKKSWVSLCLDGSVPFEELAERLDASYRFALK